MSGTEQYFTVVLLNMLHKTVNEIILVCTIILIRQHLNL